MAFVHQMNFVKRSYDSLVYIPVREMEPVKIYNSDTESFDRWLKTLLSRSGWFHWNFVSENPPAFTDVSNNITNNISSFTDLDIVWVMKDGSDPLSRDKPLDID